MMRYGLVIALALSLSPLGFSQDPGTAQATAALEEVNAARARRGLRPFLLDWRLQMAAERCASVRARFRIQGHTQNDFAYLPPGTPCSATGCAAWPRGLGWGACCTYENWTYAGAAFSVGPDGMRYMHLYVR